MQGRQVARVHRQCPRDQPRPGRIRRPGRQRDRRPPCGQPRRLGRLLAIGARLAARGAAITLAAWPADAAWPGLIARALAMDTRHLAALHDPAGAQRAADFIMAVAARFA
jgi:UDP-N-acetylglucosamine--N-acetylmuramyl-(pentapeptide) pyrophosphoryl-undecaprenol N-acetylglucosamine transferase